MPAQTRTGAKGRSISDDIQLDANSDVPLHRQLINQFIVQIAAGRLTAGEALPSCRRMEQMKKIHRHTVSRAYRELVVQGWLTRTRGSVLRVAGVDQSHGSVRNLNGVVDAAIRLAQENGYTTEQLHQCLRARLEGNRPDHVLIVSTDPGLATILKTELQEHLSCRIRVCLKEDLVKESRRIPGVMIVWIAGAAPEFSPMVPEGMSCHSITICDPVEPIRRIRQLRQPSIIAVASVSKLFLERARGVIAPLVGKFHSFTEHLLPLGRRMTLNGADLVFCDSVAAATVRAREIHPYRLTSPESLEHISRTIGGRS